MSDPHGKSYTSGCPSCDFGAFTRNNYFTGKLLVERDFTDEQRYHVEKLRHHHQRLHGWGVVCGLKVKQHENEACRDRFVCVEPGTALDCCGRELVMREEECIDLRQFPAVKALIEQQDTEEHTLQVCVRYRECPTEDIPVLYDECGCDDSQCKPNRVLESHEFDVLVDPPSEPHAPHSPKLGWTQTVGVFAEASRVALYDSGHRLYVLTAETPGKVIEVNTDNFAAVAYPLPSRGLDVAVNGDGSRLYVVAEATSNPGTDPRRLLVLNTADLTQQLVNDLEIGGSGGNDVRLARAPAPDGRLLGAVLQTGQVWVWDSTIDSAAPAPNPPEGVPLGNAVYDLTVSSDAKLGVAASETSNALHLFELANIPTHSTSNVLPAGALPVSVAVVSSTGPDTFAVADHAANQLHLVKFGPDELIGTVALDFEPVDIVVSNGGHWVYVLERDGEKSYIQAVSAQRLLQKLTVTPTSPFEVGKRSGQVVISDTGNRLYVPFAGAQGPPDGGGVAVLSITEQDCEEILWRHLEGCPSCDTPNCVVLATIERYNVGDTVNDQTDPPADPASDTAEAITRIDNRLGRRLLPSTQVLAELIECALACCGTGGSGQPGPQGPPGPQGAQGERGERGERGEWGERGERGERGEEGGRGERGERGGRGERGERGDRGDKGDQGEGLEADLTRIHALSWRHNTFDQKVIEIKEETGQTLGFGVVIGFTREVDAVQVDSSHIFQILIHEFPSERQFTGLQCYCPIVGTVVPVKFETSPTDPTLITTATRVPTTSAFGAAFVVDDKTNAGQQIIHQDIHELWVKLRCDFVVDVEGRAVDGEFVRAQLPTGDHPKGSDYGIQGGLFESWFWQGPRPAEDLQRIDSERAQVAPAQAGAAARGGRASKRGGAARGDAAARDNTVRRGEE